MVNDCFSELGAGTATVRPAPLEDCERATAQLNQGPIIDLDALAALRATMGDAFPEILAQFREDVLHYSEGVIASMNRANVSEVCRLAHSMTSAAKLFGALELSQKALQVERAARDYMNGDASSLTSALTLGLQVEVKRSIYALEALTGR